MPRREGDAKGPQQHAEGEHGERTHARIQEQLKETLPTDADNVIATHREGKHRLDEDREQRDLADRNSDRNRMDRKRD